MKIFITGANGFIGRSLCGTLEVLGHEVQTFHRQRPIVKLPTGTECVIHLAGEIYDENVMLDTNVILTKELLEAAKFAHLKSFIYIGSSSEYGEKKIPMQENMVLEPRTIYEATKGCGTLLVQGYARTYNIPTAIVRPFSVFGPDENPGRFMPCIMRAAIDKEPLIVSPGVHDFIYIKDFIAGLLVINDLTVARENDIVEIFNVGTGIETTNLQVVQIMEKLIGHSIEYTVSDNIMRSFDTNHWCADITKLKEMTGFVLKYTLEEGLQEWLNHLQIK